MKKLMVHGRAARLRPPGVAGLLVVVLVASTALFGCWASSGTPAKTEDAPSQAAQTKTTGCATAVQVTASLAKAGYGSDAAVNVVGDTVSVNPKTAKVDEGYAHGLAQVLMTDFYGAQTVLVYSADSGLTYTCTRDEASTAATPSSPAVGEIISADGYDVAVAGGKFIKQGKSKFVALKVYVKSTGVDFLTGFEMDMSVEDELGTSESLDFQALERSKLQPLDTTAYSLQDGESMGGWVVFAVDPDARNLSLVIGEDGEGSIGQMTISLEGFEKVSAESDAAKAYAVAARVGGRRVDAAELTMSEYKQVKSGMSLQKVNSIVGFKGDELSRYGSYVSYSWQNDDGSNMMVSFRSNRMYSKAQAGL